MTTPVRGFSVEQRKGITGAQWTQLQQELGETSDHESGTS